MSIAFHRFVIPARRALIGSLTLTAMAWAATASGVVATPTAGAQEVAKPSKDAVDQAAQDKQAALDKKFQEMMSGVKLVGQFTVVGQNTDKLTKEEYSILSADKVGDLWLLKARIKYGNTDKTVPLPIPVKWAGTTPVISLDNFTIPGMGTFSAHVVLDGKMYAGTWTHDKVGGHLFGTIEKLPAEETKK